MSFHSPGPWRIIPAKPNSPPTIVTERGLMVAMVAHGENHPTYSNALLIAAAPEMLAALQMALKVMVQDDTPMAYAQVRNAIKLAEGGA